MKHLLSIATLMMVFSLVFVSCSNDDDDNNTAGTNFRKIDQIMTGIDLQAAIVGTDFTWNGEQMIKVEEYTEGEVLDRKEVSYQNASSLLIDEINVYSPPTGKKSFSKLTNIIRTYLANQGVKTTDLELALKLEPTYTDGKVTRIDIYGNPLILKTLGYFGYANITYTDGKQTKISIMMSLSEGPVSEIEVSTMNAIWENGNITTAYTRVLNDTTYQYFTKDSILYTYDNKINAFSSLSAYPMFDAQLSSANNIVTETSYGMSMIGTSLVQYGTTTSTYTYDEENYPVSSVESETYGDGTLTWVRKFEYKQ